LIFRLGSKIHFGYRYGVINTTPALKTTWDKKQAQREKMVQLRQRNAAIKEQADLARQQLGEKIKANKERRAQNEIKSSQYQVVRGHSQLLELPVSLI
jgi:beta-lactamase class D